MKPVTIYLRPLNQRTQQRVDVRVADGPSAEVYGTAGYAWAPAIVTRPTMSIELMSVDMDGRVQAGRAQFEIALGNLFSTADILRLYWRGAAVVIHNTGVLEGQSAIPDFWGYVTSARLDYDTGRLNVTAEVSTAFIDRPLLTREFSGGGGINGDPAKRGTLWPAGFGVVKNIQPVWFDLTRNIGAVDGYGNTLSIDWLGEGLSSFGPAVRDYPTYDALASGLDRGEVKPGQWATCVAQGLVGLGAPSNGIITVHATFGVNRIGAFMKRILLTHAKVPAERVQGLAFDALDVAVPRPVHWWTAEQRNVKDLLEALAQSANATPLVSFQNQVTVTRAIAGAPVATLDRTGSVEPRVMDWQSADNEPPYYLLKARAARPASTLSDDQVNYVDTLEDKGVFNAATVYRAGNLVFLSDGSQWLYQNATPSAGHVPPSTKAPDAAGNVYDEWWFRRRPAPTAADFTYQDGTPIEALKPSEKGATSGAPAGTTVGGVLAEDLVGNVARIAADEWLSTAEKPQVILAYNALDANWQSLDSRYRALGSPADITPSWQGASDAMYALGQYLLGLSPGWADVNFDTRIVPTDYRDKWGRAYTAVAALNAAITGRKGDTGDKGADAMSVTATATPGNVRYDANNEVISGPVTFTAELSNAIGPVTFASARSHQIYGLPADVISFSGNSMTISPGRLKAVIDYNETYFGVAAETIIVSASGVTTRVTVTKVMDGAKGTSAPLLRTQWSIDGATNWHDNYMGADKYLRTSNDNGATWGPAVKVVGEDGTIGADGVATSIVFKRSATVPPRPTDNTGDPPTGWSDGPPEGAEILWMSVARFKAGAQQTGWSFPERITGPQGERGRPAVPFYQDAEPANPIEGDIWVTITKPLVLKQRRNNAWVPMLGAVAQYDTIAASLIVADSLAAITANIGFLVSYNGQGGRFERDGNGTRGFYNNGQIGVKIGFS